MPVYGSRSLIGTHHPFSWISQNESFTAWLNSHGPGILHVYGSTGVSDAAEYIFYCLDKRRDEKQNITDIVTLSTFRRYDARCNSVGALLSTLLAQILNHENLYYAMSVEFNQTLDQRGWTDLELLIAFSKVISYTLTERILCVINGLNECDNSSSRFLECIFQLARNTEHGFKIAFTNDHGFTLPFAFAGLHLIDLDNYSTDTNGQTKSGAPEVDPDIVSLIDPTPWVAGL